MLRKKKSNAIYLINNSVNLCNNRQTCNFIINFNVQLKRKEKKNANFKNKIASSCVRFQFNINFKSSFFLYF